jgi:hypothetical protein
MSSEAVAPAAAFVLLYYENENVFGATSAYTYAP